jgi:hypothetical protein
VAIEAYGNAKYEWLKSFLELANGIPSHDTFSRVFARIEPQQFQECFLIWSNSILKKLKLEVIAIDGQTKFSLASDTNMSGEIRVKLLIYKDSITP